MNYLGSVHRLAMLVEQPYLDVESRENFDYPLISSWRIWRRARIGLPEDFQPVLKMDLGRGEMSSEEIHRNEDDAGDESDAAR